MLFKSNLSSTGFRETSHLNGVRQILNGKPELNGVKCESTEGIPDLNGTKEGANGLKPGSRPGSKPNTPRRHKNKFRLSGSKPPKKQSSDVSQIVPLPADAKPKLPEPQFWVCTQY